MRDSEMTKYDKLKLDNQMCFPIYACSRAVIRRYGPFLKELNLTYTQYITMTVFWEYGTVEMKTLCSKLRLDSGTLTPVLKSLEAKNYIERRRSDSDERMLVCSVTEEGMRLRDKAADVPEAVESCSPLTAEEASVLYKALYKIMDAEESGEEPAEEPEDGGNDRK